MSLSLRFDPHKDAFSVMGLKLDERRDDDDLTFNGESVQVTKEEERAVMGLLTPAEIEDFHHEQYHGKEKKWCWLTGSTRTLRANRETHPSKGRSGLEAGKTQSRGRDKESMTPP
ncbi:hypothetical protein AXG93_4649s1040 [Marchantia polymorpha subsp. ruderalis]|uniref:Uncharacterized protein n=1 Tax=Marchantia polymorpha subsp. ruderalis TaxID=1480154 RepID=A0A176VHK4_MARPO|nr:hypothetical protein AXG93_4649s1040 [Marchantia polymorpha subsp. ruderalis]